MALVKFYRGTGASSLPRHEEGAIFVVESSNTTGDIYVDVADGKRLHIIPEGIVIAKTTAEWNRSSGLISEAGRVYVYSDYQTTIIDGKRVNRPGIKVGDGTSYLIDMPFFQTVTQSEVNFWNNKVNAYMATELDATSEENETLVLTREF